MTAIEATHAVAVVPPSPAVKVPWRRSLVRTLLYGKNVDRAAKTKARLGLAILVFSLGYAIIAARLTTCSMKSPRAGLSATSRRS